MDFSDEPQIVFGASSNAAAGTSDAEHYAKNHIYPKKMVFTVGGLQILFGAIMFGIVRITVYRTHF